MARVSGVDIPDNKRGEISLTYIFGIGRKMSNKILSEAGIDKNKVVAKWTDDEFKKVRDIMSKKVKTEGELKSEIRLNKKRLMDIGSYRGIRQRMGLPSRGQHTKNNARTKKGKKKTIAGKRKAVK